MEKSKIKNNIISLIITLVFFIISLLIYKNNSSKIGNLKILDDQFIINFILIVLGFGVTLITILYSTFDKLRKQLTGAFKNIINEVTLKKIELNMLDVFKELKENTLFIFRYLIELVLLSIFKVIDIPYIEWKFNYISKIDLILSIKLTIIFLTLLALFDIITSIFKLIELSLGMDIKKNK